MSTINPQIIYPMFAMVLLTAYTLIRMFVARVRSVKNGQSSIEHFRTYTEGKVAEDALKAARHFSNLFETPVLYYVVCLLGLILGIMSPVFVGLAWFYVAARFVHAQVHMGGNRLKYRMPAFGLSWVTIMIMWIFVIVYVCRLAV